MRVCSGCGREDIQDGYIISSSLPHAAVSMHTGKQSNSPPIGRVDIDRSWHTSDRVAASTRHSSRPRPCRRVRNRRTRVPRTTCERRAPATLSSTPRGQRRTLPPLPRRRGRRRPIVDVMATTMTMTTWMRRRCPCHLWRCHRRRRRRRHRRRRVSERRTRQAWMQWPSPTTATSTTPCAHRRRHRQQ